MDKSTTIVNHLNTDRIIEINISENRYIIFTLMYRTLILLDITDKDNAALLINTQYDNRAALSKAIDKIIIAATKAADNDEFTNIADTFILLNDIVNRDTVQDIIPTYNIIREDYL